MNRRRWPRPSDLTLSKDDQMKEMQWFIKAAAPFKGLEINAVSETLTVHEYESKTLAKAFRSDVVQGRPDEGNAVVHQGRRTLQGIGDQRRLRNPDGARV